MAAGFLDLNDKQPANLDGRGAWVGGEYRGGSQLFKAQYVHSKPKTGSDNKTDALGIGWVLDLSKRTTLYSSLTRFDNGSLAGTAGLGRFNAAIPAGLTTAAENKLTELVLGVRHSF